MGRDATEMKRRRERSEEARRGPRWKARRRSLKLASQVTNKAVKKQRCGEERLRGRRVRRVMMGRRDRSLIVMLVLLMDVVMFLGI